MKRFKHKPREYEFKKPKTLLITTEYVPRYYFGLYGYRDHFLMELLPETPAEMDELSKTVKEFKPEEVILYFSKSKRTDSIRTAFMLEDFQKTLKKDSRFDVTIAACRCHKDLPVYFARDICAHYMFVDCSGEYAFSSIGDQISLARKKMEWLPKLHQAEPERWVKYRSDAIISYLES